MKLLFLTAFAAALGVLPMQAVPLTLINPGFQDSGNGTNPFGWTTTEVADDLYVWGANGGIPSGTQVLAIKSQNPGSNIQQALATSEATAETFGAYTVSFDAGYRSNDNTEDLAVTFSIINITDGTVLGSAVWNPPSTSTPNNVYTLLETQKPLTITYDRNAASLAGDEIGLRIAGTVLSGTPAANDFNPTVWIDNLTVDGNQGDPDPLLTMAPPATIRSNGEAATFLIPFTNAGSTQPLTLSSVTPGGSDAGSFTVNQFTTTVAPGASGSISVTFAPMGLGGTYTADLTIVSNAAVNPTRVLPLTAQVQNPVMLLSASKVDFGSLPSNPGTVTSTITVSNGGSTAALNVSPALIGATPEFSITATPGPIAPGATGDIVISFSPGTAAGHFGSLLVIDSDATTNSRITLPVKVEVAQTAALPTALALINGAFETNNYDSSASTAPDGWLSSLVGTAGNYGRKEVPNLSSKAALFYSLGGNYLQQDLSAANAGLTADQISAVSITLARGYRNDTVTRGHILFRVSLVDLNTESEIAGRDLLLEDTGVIAGTDSNQLTNTLVRFPVAGGTNGPVALRLITVQPLLTSNHFQATAILDNISVAISGSYQPPSTSFATWAMANGLDGTAGKEMGPADDPDQDGQSNLAEFAFGSLPLSSASRPLAAAAAADTSLDGDALP